MTPSPDLKERLRNRANIAREEGNATARSDARHFDEAADEIDRLERLARPEDEAEHFIQVAIDRSPEPLRRLGEWLADQFGEDLWAHAERLLLGAAEAASGQAADALDALEAELREAERSLLVVQNAAKTVAAAHGTELEHLRQNARFDHKIRAEHESLKELNSKLTDDLLAAEADNARLSALVDEVVEEFGGSIAEYHKNGPHYTLSAGTEVFEVGILLDREELIERARNLITRAKGAGHDRI